MLLNESTILLACAAVTVLWYLKMEKILDGLKETYEAIIEVQKGADKFSESVDFLIAAVKVLLKDAGKTDKEIEELFSFEEDDGEKANNIV